MSNDHFKFPKKLRLRKRSEFKETERRRHKYHGAYVIVFVKPNDLPHSRLGITVTKKVGKATTRNWWKRRLREIFRLNHPHFDFCADIVVIVKQDVAKKEQPLYHELEADMLQTLNHALSKMKKREEKQTQSHSEIR